MSFFVHGIVYLNNGQIPNINVVNGWGTLDLNGINSSLAHRESIKNGKIIIEFENDKFGKMELFWIRHISRVLIETIVLSKVIIELKSGVVIFLEYCIRPDGTKEEFKPDLIPAVDVGINVKYNEFSELCGKDVDFRWAVRDFNTGLIDEENCPSHFYRAIDTLAHRVIRTKKTLKDSEWTKFKETIGLTSHESEELIVMTRTSTAYRHGTREKYGIEGYSQFRKITEIILLKTYNYLKINISQTKGQDLINLK